MLGRISLERGAVDHGPLRHEAIQLGPLGAAQHVADEQPMPSQLCHHPHVQSVNWIGAAKQILHEILAPLHMGQHICIQTVKRIGCHRRVVFPPDRLFDPGGADHEFVLGRTPGKLPGCA